MVEDLRLKYRNARRELSRWKRHNLPPVTVDALMLVALAGITAIFLAACYAAS